MMPARQQGGAGALGWALATGAGQPTLIVELTVTNTTGATLWMADKLVVPMGGGRFALSERLVVMNTSDPGTIRLVLGAVSSDLEATALYGATFVTLDPGGSAERRFVLPVPLRSWNPVGGTRPLSPQATHARLYVHTSASPPTGWRTFQTGEGAPIRAPRWPRSLTILEGETLPLPSCGG